MIVLVPLLAVYSPFLFQSKCFISSDHHLFYEPFARFIKEAVRQGRLPLWNPYVHLGMPQIALSAIPVFYLPDLLFVALPYSAALSLLQVFHQAIFGLGVAAIVLSLGWGFAAALVALVATSLSGYMFSLTANYSLISSIAWLPFALFSFRKTNLAESAQARSAWCALAASFTGLLVMAGRPELFAPAIFILLCHSAITIWSASQSRAPTFIYHAIAYAAAFLISMPVVLPAWEWSLVSVRAGGLPASEVSIWSANWYTLLTVIAAQPLGNLMTLGNPFQEMTADRSGFMPILASAYVGAPVVVLALIGIFNRENRLRIFLIAALVLGLLFSLGRHTPLLPALLSVFPSLGICRYPVKLIVIPLTALALLAASGMRWSMQQRVSLIAFKVAVVFAACLAAAGATLSTLGRIWLDSQSSRLALSGSASAQIGAMTLISGGLAILVLGLVWLRHKRRIDPGPFVFIVVGLIVLDLSMNATRFPPVAGTDEFYEKTPELASWIKEIDPPMKGRLFCLYRDPLSMPDEVQAKDALERTRNYYRYCRDLLLPNCNIDYRILEAGGYEACEPALYKRLSRRFINTYSDPEARKDNDRDLHAFAQASGSTYLATQIEIEKKKLPLLNKKYFRLEREDSGMNLRLYSAIGDSKRVFAADRWRWVEDREQSLNMVRNPDEFSYLPREVPAIEKRADGKNPESGKRKGSVETVILRDSAEHISIAVNAEHLSLVVLCDQYYPGWRAYVDAIAAPIYCANGFTRAVFVPPGAHLVEFDYQPGSLRNGLRLAIAGAAILIILILRAVFPSFWKFMKWTAGQE